MRSASSAASSISWVTKTIVCPRRSWSSRSSSCKSPARNGIERAEGLVHEQGAWARGDGARDPDPLLLSSGELRGITRSVLLRWQTDEPQQLVHPSGGARFVPSQQTWDDGHVLRNRVVREQTTLLDDVAHVTAQVWPFELLGGGPVDVDDAAARVVEAVDQFEQGRLAAAGGTDEDDELARLDRQRDVDDGGTRLIPVVKPLG